MHSSPDALWQYAAEQYCKFFVSYPPCTEPSLTELIRLVYCHILLATDVLHQPLMAASN
jgi:hypothetical protein